MKLAALRGEIVATLRRLEAAGLVHGTSGNVSARDPETGLVAVSPTSIAYDLLGAGDVSVVGGDGELIEGRQPSTELPMHLAIHSGRPEVGAVVHTHSPYATALGLVVDEVPVLLAEVAAAVGGPIPVVPYAPTGERAMGEAVLSAGDAWAAIVRNHGPVCLGRDLGEALRCALAVEEGSQAYALARPHGEPALLPEDELERLSRLRQRPRASGR
jgi:L-ribulose-5-phosphate 4-epimerase